MQALQSDTVAIGEDLAIRLGVKVGDPVRLGEQNFRVAALVNAEPDRMSGSLNIGLRLMLSREAFERSGLMQLGSRAAERILFKLTPGAPGVEEVRKAIKEALPESVVADFRQSHPIIHHRARPRDHVSKPGKSDCADHRVHRRGHGDACAPAAEDGSHCGDEVFGSYVDGDYPDLHSADFDARAAWWIGWGDPGATGGRGVSDFAIETPSDYCSPRLASGIRRYKGSRWAC